MLRASRRFFDSAAHEAARAKHMEMLARRKGVYEKHFLMKRGAIAFGCFLAYFPIALWWADRSDEDGHSLANPTTYHLFETLPLNGLSRLVGSVASSEALPLWAHRWLIDAACSLLSVDLSDVSDEERGGWRLLQDFFTRRLREGARPLEAEALVTAPCDGELLRWGVVDSEGRMVQVKGCTYSLQNLFRSTVDRPSSSSPAVDTQRYYFAFRLGPDDYHRFHSPIPFRPIESVHVPGYLFPVMRAATKLLPMLYVNNERVVLNGLIANDTACGGAAPASSLSPSSDNQPRKSGRPWWQFWGKPSSSSSLSTNADSNSTNKAATSSSSPSSSLAALEACGAKVSMAFVGATCVGGVHLTLDSRVRTNMVEPPPYALHRKYDKDARPLVLRGDELGYFSIGSAIVLAVDVPRDCPVVVTEGQRVKVGQALIRKA